MPHKDVYFPQFYLHCIQTIGKSNFDSCSVVKYADDTAIVGKILNDNVSEYLDQVNRFVRWCNENFLNLNVKKTKEMIFDFRKRQSNIQLLDIASESVERVSEYKYLGIVIDNKLTGSQNTQLVFKKCIQRVHHLRILKNLNVNPSIVTLLYKSIVESVLCFSISIWYGRITCNSKSKLKKIVKTSSKLGASVTPLEDLYNACVLAQVKKIMSDQNHPLHDVYHFLKSGKRLALPRTRTTRYKNSFVPKSIKLFNHFT